MAVIEQKIFEQNSEIYKKFSSNNWILIDSASFIVPKDFNVESKKKWAKSSFESLLDEDNDWKKQRLKMAVSPEINGYRIIDGEILTYSVKKELLELFSTNGGIYHFHIHLWNPSMSFEYYENGKCKRSYSVYSKQEENGELNFVEEAFGELSHAEAKSLSDFPIMDTDYNYFWFPLRFMNCASNMTTESLNKAFTEEGILLEVSQKIKEKVEK